MAPFPSLLTVLALCLVAVPAAAQPVVVQLNSVHQWRHAGYYAAIDQGYFREAGLDVTLRSAIGDSDPVAPVVAGDATYGVGGSELLLHHARGEPVVALAAIFQHSPLVLIARADAGIDHLHQIVGRPIAFGTHSAELLALLQREQVPLDQLGWRPRPDGLRPLIDGEVDAISASLTTAPLQLARAGVAYRTFSPRMAGIDFYGEVLFTSRQQAERNPEQVRAFLAAVRRGWQYAVEDPGRTAALIDRDYDSPYDLAQLSAEAARSMPLIMPDMVEIGYMHAGRWQHIAEVTRDVGLVDRLPSLDGFLLRDAEPPGDRGRILLWSALATIAALFFGGLSLAFHRLIRRLRDEIGSRSKLEERLREMAYTDALTGALNRRSFIEQFRRLRAQASRDSQNLALISCDLDLFKQFNDTWGHETGDRALTHFVAVVRGVLREGDLLARAGGEEFLILLPNSAMPDAQGVAERLHQSLNATPMDIHDMLVPLTASIGVAMVAPEEDEDRSLRRADSALYEAKRLGRNRVCVAEEA